MAFAFGEIVSVIAVSISGYAVWTTTKLNKRQSQLTALLLKQGENEACDANKADLDAAFIKLGSSQHRLKIWNRGQAPARNIRIDFPDGNDVLIGSELREKFPLEILGRSQSVELIARVHMRTKLKHKIQLMWTDGFSDTNKKVVYPTL